MTTMTESRKIARAKALAEHFRDREVLAHSFPHGVLLDVCSASPRRPYLSLLVRVGVWLEPCTIRSTPSGRSYDREDFTRRTVVTPWGEAHAFFVDESAADEALPWLMAEMELRGRMG